jgi:hypothetical protein
MRKIMMLALLVCAASLLTGAAAAQTRRDAPHYQYVQYVAAPVLTNSCLVNGVVYGVDANSSIWAQDAYGRWFIMGRIVATPNGYIAVRNDGVRFPASCQ